LAPQPVRIGAVRGWALAVAVLLSPAPAWALGEAPEAIVGWGYYELLHVGAAIHPNGRSTVGALVGTSMGATGADDWTLGLSYAHDVGKPLWEVQLGWKTEAIYWAQSDSNYDWQLLSLLLGVTAVRPVTPALALALDVAGVFTYPVVSDRKQDVEFSHPQKWNVSVCLELWIHFGDW
jgi:hypothetical protein